MGVRFILTIGGSITPPVEYMGTSEVPLKITEITQFSALEGPHKIRVQLFSNQTHNLGIIGTMC